MARYTILWIGLMIALSRAVPAYAQMTHVNRVTMLEAFAEAQISGATPPASPSYMVDSQTPPEFTELSLFNDDVFTSAVVTNGPGGGTDTSYVWSNDFSPRA